MSFTIGARGARTALAALAMSAALAVPQAEASVTFPGEGVAFNVSKQNPSNTHQGIGAQNVHINGSSVINTTAHVSAGGFALTGDNGVGDFIAWCLDTMKYLTLASTYAVNNTDPFTDKEPELTSGQKTDIKRLFDTAYDALLGSAPNNEGSAAFQLALWEIVNEKDGNYDLSSGSFYTTSNPGASGAANTLLGNLGNATDKYRLVFLESVGTTSSQNLVSVVPVPLPAAGILMLAALAGGAAAYRRRKAA